jgi:hypothetical protein
MRLGSGRFFAIALVASVACVASRAEAQNESSSTFFSEGQRLMAQGKFQEACPKFEKALSLNPGAGTKFNLADCYEKTGRLASALTLFREVEDVTRQVGQKERSATAKQRADALEPRIPSIVLHAPWVNESPRAELSLDGRTLAPDALDKPIRVDLGAHVAIARLEGAETRADATVEHEGESVSLVLAAPRPASVAKLPPSPPPAAAATDDDRTGHTQRIAGLVVGGVGVVALGIGAIVVLGAKSTYDDATVSCGKSCPHDETKRANDARDSANLGGIVLGVGLAAAATGAVLFLAAPSRSVRSASASVRLAPGAARGALGLTALGEF